jgi:hypothetical protein
MLPLSLRKLFLARIYLITRRQKNGNSKNTLAQLSRGPIDHETIRKIVLLAMLTVEHIELTGNLEREEAWTFNLRNH